MENYVFQNIYIEMIERSTPAQQFSKAQEYAMLVVYILVPKPHTQWRHCLRSGLKIIILWILC